MNIVLRQVVIIDRNSPFHQQQQDILIVNGIISQIQSSIDAKELQQIHIPGLHVSPGWIDIFANFCDPGYEFKETLETGAVAAASGGYTDVFVIPNTSPILHNKASVEYVRQKTNSLPINVHPIGAISRNAEGKELAEMYDMASSGAIAFSDGSNTLQASGILLKALQYVKAINKIIIQLPDDKSLSALGLMNESKLSNRLGLLGKPSIAEELMIVRDLELTKYAESSIHFTGISTSKSVDLIRKAKKEGISVTCSVSPFHLFFTEEDLADYDTNLKFNPPLRSIEDQNALKLGLEDGTIDCIASHHFPEDVDHKLVEFENAHDGAISLETTFAILKTALPTWSLADIIEKLAINPRKIFGLPLTTVDLNQPACLSLFAPHEKWTVKNIKSKSHNSPFLGKELTGKPIGIINKDKVFLTE
jgi:dihydroorotase